MGRRGPTGTFDVDALARMASEGLSSAEIASAMGVSRQRISQVALKNGVHISRKKAVQHSRIATGGIDPIRNTNVSGTVCELLVAADLSARGWKVFFPIVRGGPHDLVACKGRNGGVLKSFEVRAGRKTIAGKISFQRDRIPRSTHYAIVVEGEPVMFEPELE